MDAAAKQRMFDLLVTLGVTEIEVGFPSASKTDFDFRSRRLIDDNLIPTDTTIAVLTPARPELIERTYQAIRRRTQRDHASSTNSTSETQRRIVFPPRPSGRHRAGRSRATALCKTLASQTDHQNRVRVPRRKASHGTELDYALEICEAVIAEWGPQQL